MLTVAQALQDFITEQRQRFNDENNNLFAFSLGQVERYYRLLGLVLDRYIEAGAHWLTTLRRWNATAAALRQHESLDADLVALWETLDKAVLSAQLEVETFYLLAKIMLDRIAHFIEFYFGAAQKCSLDSHDDLNRCFKRYCALKELEYDDRLTGFVADLKHRISDFRDYHISHEKSGRTIRGINVSSHGRVVMPMGRIFPKASDKVVISEDLVILGSTLDDYLLALLAFLRRNSSRSRLTAT